ncbi:MAG: iron-sulfur cluster assembly scaffold protein [Rhizobiales bacterium]|nr:iron-sulfur cluster assembly scaffold protein [Hyphomicrobiales bacterium]
MSQRLTASELCDRGLRRRRLEPLAIVGPTLHGNDGLTAQFSLRCEGDAVTSIRFKASSCATLLAYCELIAELAVGRSIAECARLSAGALVATLSDVPVFKRDRAILAVSTFHQALAQTKRQMNSIQSAAIAV